MLAPEREDPQTRRSDIDAIRPAKLIAGLTSLLLPSIAQAMPIMSLALDLDADDTVVKAVGAVAVAAAVAFFANQKTEVESPASSKPAAAKETPSISTPFSRFYTGPNRIKAAQDKGGSKASGAGLAPTARQYTQPLKKSPNDLSPKDPRYLSKGPPKYLTPEVDASGSTAFQ
jgi:hypothetical protein